jgi:sulfatase modifying factor 1
VAHYLETSARSYEYQDMKTAHIGFRTAMTYIGRSGTMSMKTNRRSRR